MSAKKSCYAIFVENEKFSTARLRFLIKLQSYGQWNLN
jgi:hypothetical protein